MASRLQRHERIAALIQAHPVHSQHELLDLLDADGISTTQATLSRDLRELDVFKTAAGYVLSNGVPTTNGDDASLARTLTRELLSADCGSGMVVLKTMPGHANALAIEIDRARLPEILGTIAGDDTIFISTRTARQAKQLTDRFRQMAGHEQHA